MGSGRSQGMMLVLAMALGWMLGSRLESALPLIPYIIALMLFMTFLGVHPRDMALRRSHLLLLTLQVVGSAIAYGLGRWLFSEEVAVAMMYCVMTPAATAGPVIVRLLRGDAGYTTTYVLVSHLMLILTAPIVLPSVAGGGEDVAFWTESLAILERVSLLILPALLGAWILRALIPQMERLAEMRLVSYWLWLGSLVLLMAQTAIGLESQSDHLGQVGVMALVALGTCVTQFALGDYLGHKLSGEAIAIRHSFGQKNTTLAIWLATMWLPPMVALASATYILCQNLAISYLLGRSDCTRG